MSKPCELCNTDERVDGERYCPTCKKVLKAKWKAEHYAKEPPPRTCGQYSDMRGRRSRSTQLLGGTVDIVEDEE